MQRNTLLTLIGTAVLTLATTACLDEKPLSQLTEEQAMENAKSIYYNTVANLYNYIGGSADSQGLQGTYRGVYDFNTFTTDEAMLPTRGADWYDGGFWQNLYLHTWPEYDEALYNTWLYLYKVVGLCNQSLENLYKYAGTHLSEQETLQYTAEVRAIRAMFYFYLLDMFGRVPLQVDTSKTLAKQAERSTVFRFVFDELQNAIPHLSSQMSQHEGYAYGKMTQGVAYFLLAKLALNAEIYADDNWTDALHPDGKTILFEVDGRSLNAWETTLAYCTKLDEMGYRLEEDYGYNFSIHNEESTENIFTIPMDKTLYTNVFRNLLRSRHYQHGSALGCYAENGACATVSTVRAYGYNTPQEDTRWERNFESGPVVVDGKAILLEDGTPLVYSPLEVSIDLSGSPYEKTGGARMKKYETDRSAYNDGTLQSNDIVLFRYADALLMAAEAKTRNGQDGAAELNQVRERVGMAPREATLDNILEERLLELMWEGWRRQDLVRFGRFGQAYDQRPQLKDEQTGYTTVFPIPAAAHQLNRQLKQNPGYKNN